MEYILFTEWLWLPQGSGTKNDKTEKAWEERKTDKMHLFEKKDKMASATASVLWILKCFNKNNHELLNTKRYPQESKDPRV